MTLGYHKEHHEVQWYVHKIHGGVINIHKKTSDLTVSDLR